MHTSEISDSSRISNIKPGRVDGKNSYYRSGATPVGHTVTQEINNLLEQHRDKAAYRNKKVGHVTQERREKGIKGFFSDLFFLGYKLESIHNIKQKHLKAVFHLLEEQGQSPATIQNKISLMRLFCGWIGKGGMVISSSEYVKDKSSVRRSMVVTEDKSWSGNGIDPMSKLEQISQKDRHVGMWLELCWAFGLRVQEAVMLRPAVAHEGSFIWVREGTKGDRPRVIPIENMVQADVIVRAKLLSDKKTGMLGVRGKSVEQNIQRMYYVMRVAGLTLFESGVSAHGLRHQYMHASFERLTGEKPPVLGGKLELINQDAWRTASMKLAERAGHTRVTIGAGYYGSRRRPRNVVSYPVEPQRGQTAVPPQYKGRVYKKSSAPKGGFCLPNYID